MDLAPKRALENPASASSGARLEPATVVATSGARLAVRLADGSARTVSNAAWAMPAAGERVLVALTGEEGFVLALPDRAPLARLEVRGGAHALAEGDRLEVRDGAGRLLFVHDAASGRSEVRALGDLSFVADEGSIALSARDGVRLSARDGARAAELAVEAGGVRLSGETFSARADEARMSFTETRFSGELVESRVESVRHVVEVLELEAGRIVERSKQVYREVEELAHLRAGRIRQIATGAMHLLARRHVLKAEDDVAIKGSRIELA